MNILTFDIEEWFIEKHNRSNNAEKIATYDRLLNEVLDLLDERNIKATFFCVGGMASDFPHVVRLIESRGHEIGCHSNIHTWLNKMSPSEVLKDTSQAVDSLEQCVGKKVISYRAPAFSIGKKNLWAFEALAKCGIERDASVFPASRDFGGFPDFGYKSPIIIEYEGIRIKEFPICTTSFFGKELAYSGGGYFRFFPLWFICKEINNSDYTMCYFHLSDIMEETKKMMSRKEYEGYFKENGSLIKRYKRYIKSNLGKKNAYSKLKYLINNYDFENLSQLDKSIDWENASKVVL